MKGAPLGGKRMNFSMCPRCQSEEFETKFSACMNCNYGIDNDEVGEVPIPAWVLRHINPTAGELAEIREINFGIQPAKISVLKPHLKDKDKTQTYVERPAPTEGPPPVIGKAVELRRKAGIKFSNYDRDAFAFIETGQAVM